jgi:hypothetical protein
VVEICGSGGKLLLAMGAVTTIILTKDWNPVLRMETSIVDEGVGLRPRLKGAVLARALD